MKKLMITTMLIGLAMIITGQLTSYPEFYYTNDSMVEQIFEWEEQYPDIFKVRHIGNSQQDELPIYAVKLSNNVHVNEDKPAILIVGSLHAEEVIGTEIVMHHIKQMLERPNFPSYRPWLNDLEMWFIPNLNPEGWKVVTDGLDRTYRKNKRDNLGNGQFDFVPGMGYDKDGVDLNRNFAFNWVHGDSLFEVRHGTVEVYDYYRGPDPMSEAEIQALLSLTEEQHFVYSVIWHSSRSGNFSEKVYHPFNWDEVYPSPDLEVARSISSNFASRIRKLNSSSYYESLDAAGRNGNADDWFYKEYGTIQLLAETGPPVNIQPDRLELMQEVRDECIKGQEWLFNRALRDGPLDRVPMLTGRVSDGVTGEPLRAEIIVQERHARYFTPRLSNETHGRFWRPLLAGTYTLTVRKEGYETVTLENVAVNNSTWTERHVQLQPLSATRFSGTILLEGSPVDAEIQIRNSGWEPVDYYTHHYEALNGTFSIDLWEGEKDIIVTAEGAYPYVATVDLYPGNHQTQINLSSKELIYTEDWESSTENWLVDGPWEIITPSGWDGGQVIIESYDGGRNFYEPDADVSIITSNPIDLTDFNPDSSQPPMLTFWQNLYTVWDRDNVYVDVSVDQEEWITIYKNSGQLDYWHPVFVSLEQVMGEEVYLRFRLKTNNPTRSRRLIDPGWMIDNIEVFGGAATFVNVEYDNVETIIPVTALHQNYPNPFNPETTISFTLFNRQIENAHISIYNIKGALVEKIALNDTDLSRGSIVWNAENQSSGVYLYQLVLDGTVFETRKSVLMK